MKLLKSEDSATDAKYDSILMIVDKLTKYTYLISYNEKFTAKQIVWIVLDRVIRHHGILETITLDRDRIFTSNFWQTLMAEIGTKIKLSTAYYPQTDEQTERTNQTLKIYLRYYMNHSQKNWIQLLPMAQLTLNNKTLTVTGKSVFYTNFGRHSNLFNVLRKSLQTTVVLLEVDQLRNIYKEMLRNIEYYQKRSESQINKKRIKKSQLKKGDKIYLFIKNLKILWLSRKLDYKKVDSFIIKTKKSNVTFELELSKGMKIHPVFHVSLLESANPETPAQDKPPKLSPDNEYEVESPPIDIVELCFEPRSIKNGTLQIFTVIL